MWQIWILLLISYGLTSYYSLVLSARPSSPCVEGQPCYGPILSAGQPVLLELWLYQREQQHHADTNPRQFNWNPVPTCRFNVTIPEPGSLPELITTKEKPCALPIPNSARRRSADKNLVEPLKARFTIRFSENSSIIGNIPFEISRIVERLPRKFWSGRSVHDSSTGFDSARNLLEQPLQNKASNTKPVNELKESVWIPFIKYGRSAVRLRFVAEDRNYGVLERADGLQLQAWNATCYAPMVYVDDLSLQRSSQIELAPPEDDKPPFNLQIKINSLSPVLDTMNRQAHAGFGMVEQLLPGEELDEIRYFLQDERLYRFMITQVISYLHITFDYLAFRDEIRFYRGRKNLSGVSTSTSITRFVCSLIIFLYLLDGGGTSWVVLVSMFGSVCVDLWKVWKLLRPELITKFPFIAIRQIQSSREQETANYDRIAFKNLVMVLYPLVIGWSTYALYQYEYKSWYSWLISNLANAVYTFGFISLCPQLYVNYRLKSVAHLPWKVFMYKIFNTFVDDAFAWIIEMPWKHRIMTLRDDVVFLMFLVQVYLYRVDKSRTNEFGYSYDDDYDNIGPQQKVKEKKHCAEEEGHKDAGLKLKKL